MALEVEEPLGLELWDFGGLLMSFLPLLARGAGLHGVALEVREPLGLEF